MKCCVLYCTNESRKNVENNGFTFHKFPNDPNLHKAWIEALGLLELDPDNKSTVCSDHFKSEDFYYTKHGLRLLKEGVVPVEFNPVELESSAALKVCRVCLAMDTRMYNIKERNFKNLLRRFTGPIWNDDAKLPQIICWECMHLLKKCNDFWDKIIQTQNILLEMLLSENYVSVKNIKSINRYKLKMASSLTNVRYEHNDFDLVLAEGEGLCDSVDTVAHRAQGDDDQPEHLNGEVGIKEEATSDLAPLVEVEVKDERTSNDIFFDECIDNQFDSDDNRTLSEVVERPKGKVSAKGRRNGLKKKVKLKNIKAVKRKAEDENPLTAIDKYKKSDVKRRKTQDALDESLFTITTLSYEEQIADIERRQDSDKYKNAPYKCTKCYRGFVNKERYDAHDVRHSDKSGIYECFICKTRLKTSRALRKHLTAQHTERFSCNGCPFVTQNRGVAREHEKWHGGTKYQCPHCASDFDKLTTYLGHIRIKHVSDFVCELCGYTFVSEKGIEVHKKKKHRLDDKTVPEDGPYCEVCDVRFISEEVHLRHLKLSSRHSSDDDPNRIRNDSQSKASKCGTVSRRAERRAAIHPRDISEMRQESGPVTCEQCGAQLRDLRLYAQHFRRAHPDKNRTKYPAMKTPCMCEQCGRIFQSMALLKDHMWVHTGEKRFKCDRCEKSFTQKTNLVFHMRVHSASRPSYECPLCGKHFAFFNNRRRHMFIHTGLKPYKCDTCGKSFTTSGEQRAHVEHVHMKKPWPKRARRGQQNEQWQKCNVDGMHVNEN